MRKLLLVLALAFCGQSWALKDTIKSDGLWSALTWSTGTTPGPSDTVYRTGNYNDTMDYDTTIAGFWSASTCTGHHIRTGRRLTITAGPCVFDGTSAAVWKWGNKLVVTGNNIKITETINLSGIVVRSTCTLDLQGNRDTLAVTRAFNPASRFNDVYCAYPSCTTFTSITSYISKFFMMGGKFGGSTFLVPYTTTSGMALKMVGDGLSIFTGIIYLPQLALNSISDTLDTINAPLATVLNNSILGSTSQRVIVNKINAPLVSYAAISSLTTKLTTKWLTDSVIVKSFTFGHTSTANNQRNEFNSTVFKVDSVLTGAGTGYDTSFFSTSTWNVTGKVTLPANLVEDAGTSTWNATTGAGTWTLNGNSLYDVNVNSTSGEKTFADSLKLAVGGDYIITAGNVTHSTKTICSQGDIINNSTGTFVWPTSVCLKGTNYNMHIDAACGVQTMESTVFAPTRSGTIDIDKVDTLGPITALDSVRTTIGGAGNAFYSVLSAKNFTTTDSLTIDSLYMPDSAGVVLKSAAGTRVNKTTAALLSGAAGKLNRYTASTPGSAARLFLPAEYTLSYVSLTDITVSPAQVADATSVNGGGNTGWTFQTGTTTRRRGGGGLRLNGGLDLGL